MFSKLHASEHKEKTFYPFTTQYLYGRYYKLYFLFRIFPFKLLIVTYFLALEKNI